MRKNAKIEAEKKINAEKKEKKGQKGKTQDHITIPKIGIVELLCLNAFCCLLQPRKKIVKQITTAKQRITCRAISRVSSSLLVRHFGPTTAVGGVIILFFTLGFQMNLIHIILITQPIYIFPFTIKTIHLTLNLIQPIVKILILMFIHLTWFLFLYKVVIILITVVNKPIMTWIYLKFLQL